MMLPTITLLVYLFIVLLMWHHVRWWYPLKKKYYQKKYGLRFVVMSKEKYLGILNDMNPNELWDTLRQLQRIEVSIAPYKVEYNAPEDKSGYAERGFVFDTEEDALAFMISH